MNIEVLILLVPSDGKASYIDASFKLNSTFMKFYQIILGVYIRDVEVLILQAQLIKRSTILIGLKVTISRVK